MRILIADDDRVVAGVLSGILRQWEFQVLTAHDGGRAWALLNEYHPPIAVLDWEMPIINGVELCRRIRADASLAQMYVIMLTSRDGAADVAAGLEAGADDYLVKPFDRAVLEARVRVGERAALHGRRTEQVAH